MALVLLFVGSMPFLATSLEQRVAVLSLCVLAVGSGGCSYLFVDGPPKQHRQLPYFTCTTSRTWPVVDTVLGSIYGIAAVGALADGSSRERSSSEISTAVVAGGMAALLVASAISGYHDTGECREAIEELQVRLSRQQPWFGPTPNARPPHYDPWLQPMQKPLAPPASQPGNGREASAPSAPTEDKR